MEPSDDENSSDDSFPEFGSEWNSEVHSPQSNRLELYLLKKQLRLESSRLVKRAKIAVPVVQTAKHFKNCVGAAFRARAMNRRRQALTGVEVPRLRTCLYVKNLDENEQNNGQKLIGCSNTCLPNSNHCQEHMLYNIKQKLFSYCSKRCCGRPVLCIESIHTDGLCRKHYEESENADKLLTNPQQNSNSTILKSAITSQESSTSLSLNNVVVVVPQAASLPQVIQRRNIQSSSFLSNSRISNISSNILSKTTTTGSAGNLSIIINGNRGESINSSTLTNTAVTNNLFFDDNNLGAADQMNDTDGWFFSIIY